MIESDDEAVRNTDVCHGHPDIDEGLNMFRGSYLDYFVDASTATCWFGPDYKRALVGSAIMEAIILGMIDPPMESLGIDFAPFAMPENISCAESCNEILQDIDSMGERFEWYSEVADHTPPGWLNVNINEHSVARHLPLLRTHMGRYLSHAQHLYTFLDHAFLDPKCIALFGSGPHQTSLT